MNTTHPRSACAASPSRGRHAPPGKAGVAVARACVGLAAVLLTTAAVAQMSPVGTWRSIDDKSGEAKAEIRIVDNGGVLSGRIERTLRKDARTTCEECRDERKGQAIQGLEIIRGARKAEGQEGWEHGKILDPENGKEYTLRLTPVEGGQKLQVRGYVGPFFRTQTWVRVQ